MGENYKILFDVVKSKLNQSKRSGNIIWNSNIIYTHLLLILNPFYDLNNSIV